MSCLLAAPRSQSAQPEPYNKEAAAIKNPVPRTPESIAGGGQVFKRSCGACHGLDGKGGRYPDENPNPGPSPPDLTDGQWDFGSTDGEIFWNTKHGIPPYMDKWGDQLKDEQIWNIVNYIRSLVPAKPK